MSARTTAGSAGICRGKAPEDLQKHKKVRMRSAGVLKADDPALRTDGGKPQYGLSLCMDLYLFRGRRQSYADACYLIYAFST